MKVNQPHVLSFSHISELRFFEKKTYWQIVNKKNGYTEDEQTNERATDKMNPNKDIDGRRTDYSRAYSDGLRAMASF